MRLSSSAGMANSVVLVRGRLRKRRRSAQHAESNRAGPGRGPVAAFLSGSPVYTECQSFGIAPSVPDGKNLAPRLSGGFVSPPLAPLVPNDRSGVALPVSICYSAGLFGRKGNLGLMFRLEGCRKRFRRGAREMGHSRRRGFLFRLGTIDRPFGTTPLTPSAHPIRHANACITVRTEQCHHDVVLT